MEGFCVKCCRAEMLCVVFRFMYPERSLVLLFSSQLPFFFGKKNHHSFPLLQTFHGPHYKKGEVPCLYPQETTAIFLFLIFYTSLVTFSILRLQLILHAYHCTWYFTHVSYLTLRANENNYVCGNRFRLNV